MGYIKPHQALAALVIFSASAVQAACHLENRIVFSCPIEGREKQLTICLKIGLPEPTIGYEMRDMSGHDINGKVELFIERDIMDVHYANTGGKSQNLNESVSFESGNLVYHVDMITTHAVENDRRFDGGIRVFEDEKEIASWACQSGRGHMETNSAWLMVDQYRRMGYQWCAGFGSFAIDDMRYRDCSVQGEKDGFDQLTGAPEPDQSFFIAPLPEGFKFFNDDE